MFGAKKGLSLRQIWQELADKGHGTDKGSAHSYLPVYEKLFAPYRDQPIRLLEIGVDRGYSLEMWRAYFTHAEIVGLDIAAPIEVPGVTVLQGDSTDQTVAEEIGDFDIIIDDGSHGWQDQMRTFQLFDGNLSFSGLYVIEDIASEEGLRELRNFAAFHAIDFRSQSGQPDDVMLIYPREAALCL
jgi:hypothetical protein